MTNPAIHSLCRAGALPGDCSQPELVETHISWVLIGREFVYKLKKPLHYSFLDFSTFEKRRHYCEREVELNRRLTEDVYLGVVPVRQHADTWTLGGEEGAVADHAVWMRKMDPRRRMDLLARENQLTDNDIITLAKLLALFHQRAIVAADPPEGGDADAMKQLFNDLARETAFLETAAGRWAGDTIRRCTGWSNHFLQENAALLAARRWAGLFRDGHGDLHCRNIFLLNKPQVFDCIEFNDDLRRIDVLNDIAFLCMDLDSSGLPHLARRFLDLYASYFPSALDAAGRRLFHYYKAYRANIRAKINSLRARDASSVAQRTRSVDTAAAYLRLMDSYRLSAGTPPAT